MSAFLRLWFWFSFRQFRLHLWRSIAVLLGISLGAAVFTSVRLATNASVQSFANSVDAISGKADRTVVLPGGRVPEELVRTLLHSSEIRAASPLSSAYVRADVENPVPILLIGIDPILEHSLRSWKSDASGSDTWRELIGTPYTLIAGKRFLEQHGLHPGDSVRLHGTNQSASFRILGGLEPEGPASLEGGNLAVTDIASFQEFTGEFGGVDRIDLLLVPPVTGQKLQAIRKLLPHGFSLEQPSETRETGQVLIRSYQLNLSVLSFVSLFVGMFLVYSLISLHATSRRKELAVLRAVGASHRTLFFVFITEGLFFGLAGWVPAVPMSFFMTKKLLGYVSSTISSLFVRVHVEGLGLNPWELILSFGITLAVAVAAASQPAFEASRVHARDALLIRETPSGKEGKLIRKLALLGTVMAAAVWPLSRLPAVAGVPLPGYLATFFLFLGFALLSPFWLRTAGSYLPPLARRLAGETAYLGARYLKDAGARIAISVGALITAIGLFVALAIMVHSFRETVQTWVHQSINGDIYVRPRMSDLNRYKDSLPPDVVAELNRLRSEVDLVPYHRMFLDQGGVPYVFEPMEIESYMRRSRFLFLEGKLDRTGPGAKSGAVISEVYSNQSGLHTGDRFRAVVEGTPIDLPILAVVRDYRTQGGVVYLSLDRFARASGDFRWTGASIFLKNRGPDLAEKAAGIRSHILLFAAERGYNLDVIDGASLRANILRIFDETFAITTVLLVISLLIAALGIATTLTILVLERVTQFQTMRATGAGAGQIRMVIGWEAVLMVVLGEVLGLACGFILSFLLIFVINRQSFGWTFIYSIDWTALAASFPLVCATALLAAIPATQLIFRQPPAQVLKNG